MGFLPEWNQQNSFQQANLGQHSLFTNPNMQQSRPMQLANALRQQPQVPAFGMQPQMPNFQQQVAPNPMQPQPFQANTQNTNLMGGGNPQAMQNWNSQYGSN